MTSADNYPTGAANDPSAPYNQPMHDADECPACGTYQSSDEWETCSHCDYPSDFEGDVRDWGGWE